MAKWDDLDKELEFEKEKVEELIDYVKELISRYQKKSKQLRNLKERYVNLLNEYERTDLEMENLENENRYFKTLTDKWPIKPLSEQDIALQEFIVTGIDKRVASMIYNFRRNRGEGTGFTKEFGKPKITPPPCPDCIKKGLKAYFVLVADKTKVLNHSEPEASES